MLSNLYLNYISIGLIEIVDFIMSTTIITAIIITTTIRTEEEKEKERGKGNGKGERKNKVCCS